MLSFGLRSTSDDWPSDLSNESGPKCKKRPPKSSKNEMLSFGLRSTSDDWPSDLSNESQLKCEKGPISHQKMKCSFLDYVQLLMIGHAIRVKKVDQNGMGNDDQLSDLSDESEKCPPSHHKMKYSFLHYIQLLMIGQVIRVTKVNLNAKKAP